MVHKGLEKGAQTGMGRGGAQAGGRQIGNVETARADRVDSKVKETAMVRGRINGPTVIDREWCWESSRLLWMEDEGCDR